MNGLQYIRVRCNLSLSELAEQLGVTRQAVSAWENGKKEIPEQRRKELADFLGVSESLLGDLTDEDKVLLLEKAMFRHDINGKEKYSYKPNNNNSNATLCFIGELEESFDKSFIKAKQRKANLLKKIDGMIDGGKASCLVARTSMIDGGCDTFEIMTTLLDQVPLQERFIKVPFRLEMQNVFEAMLIAYAGKNQNEVKNSIESSGMSEYEDYDFIEQLVELFQRHWSDKKLAYEEMYGPEARKKAQKWYKGVKQEQEKMSQEERIRKAETDYRESQHNGDGVAFVQTT